MKEREYKDWLDKHSNRHNPDFDGLERFSLTWVQIREIISEENQILLKKVEDEFRIKNKEEWEKFKKIYGQ